MLQPWGFRDELKGYDPVSRERQRNKLKLISCPNLKLSASGEVNSLPTLWCSELFLASFPSAEMGNLHLPTIPFRDCRVFPGFVLLSIDVKGHTLLRLRA